MLRLRPKVRQAAPCWCRCIGSAERPARENRDGFPPAEERARYRSQAPPEFVVWPLMREIRAFRYLWPSRTKSYRVGPNTAKWFENTAAGSVKVTGASASTFTVAVPKLLKTFGRQLGDQAGATW